MTWTISWDDIIATEFCFRLRGCLCRRRRLRLRDNFRERLRCRSAERLRCRQHCRCDESPRGVLICRPQCRRCRDNRTWWQRSDCRRRRSWRTCRRLDQILLVLINDVLLASSCVIWRMGKWEKEKNANGKMSSNDCTANWGKKWDQNCMQTCFGSLQMKHVVVLHKAVLFTLEIWADAIQVEVIAAIVERGRFTVDIAPVGTNLSFLIEGGSVGTQESKVLNLQKVEKKNRWVEMTFHKSHRRGKRENLRRRGWKVKSRASMGDKRTNHRLQMMALSRCRHVASLFPVT